VVVATGENWPDALGGSALAGAVRGPLLLTRKVALSAEVLTEIKRLGASKSYILGSSAAVSAGVENTLVALLGRTNVVRLGGSNRYETAQRIADEAIRVAGYAFTGEAFVATGGNFPDATAAAPVASFFVRPILLANPATGSVYVPSKVWGTTILGSTSAVSAKVEASLKARPGMFRVTRLGGANRYETAALIAKAGVAAGMRWDGVGLATGLNFPDALAGGAMLGGFDSVLLLTSPTSLSAPAQSALKGNSHEIWNMHIFGGPTSVSPAVEAAAKAAAGL
jgi:putative cell wall-binding protein